MMLPERRTIFRTAKAGIAASGAPYSKPHASASKYPSLFKPNGSLAHAEWARAAIEFIVKMTPLNVGNARHHPARALSPKAHPAENPRRGRGADRVVDP